MKKIVIAGAGMGEAASMTAELQDLAACAELIIGAERIVKPFRIPDRRVIFEYRPDQIQQMVRNAPEQEILILVTGDPGFYSAAGKIAARLRACDYDPVICPGISSVAYFSARIGIPYSDAALLSAHGRSVNLASEVRRHPVSFVLAGGNLAQLLGTLCEYGFSGCMIYTGENLSYPTEKIRRGTAAELLRQAEKEPFSTLSLMAVLNPGAEESVPFGISDDEFLRGAVPMTKREARSFLISVMQLRADSLVVDIGAGTGSVSVEAALSAYRGTVYALEKNPEAQDLIRANAVRFHTDNIKVVKGEAPEALAELPPADVYYVGGSGGRLKEILEQIERMMEPEKQRICRVVISAVTMQTLTETQALLCDPVWQNVSCTQIQASRTHRIGAYDLMKAENPVFIITADLNKR